MYGASVSKTVKNRTLYSSNPFYHCVYGGGRSFLICPLLGWVQLQFGIPQQLNKTAGVKLDGAGVITSKLLVPLLVPDSSSC